jgi:hypothetical protein
MGKDGCMGAHQLAAIRGTWIVKKTMLFVVVETDPPPTRVTVNIGKSNPCNTEKRRKGGGHYGCVS